jgi:hypothetical protein
MGSSFQELLKLVEQFADSGKSKKELQEAAEQVISLRQKLAEDQDLADAVLKKLMELISKM